MTKFLSVYKQIDSYERYDADKITLKINKYFLELKHQLFLFIVIKHLV